MTEGSGIARVLRCEGVLFDLDGVLADSTASVERHWRSWAELHELDVDLVMRTVHGRRAIETMGIVAPHLDAATEVQALVRREALDSGDVGSVAGADAMLAALPSGRWGIVTSGVRTVALARLAAVGISPPEVLVTADDVSRGKPDPEGYLEGARQLGLEPFKCVVVEDAPLGVAAAQAAGMRALAVATTYPREALLAAEAVAPSLESIEVRVSGAQIELAVRAS